MLKLGSTYLIVKDIEASIKFYEALLDMPVSAKRYDRWAQFNFDGKCIALFNPNFDKDFMKTCEEVNKHYSPNYIEFHKNREIQYGNNIVLNFYIEELGVEYERLKALNIGKMTDLMYLNISSPYNHFLLEDPDGNVIEITGKFNQRIEAQ